MEIELYPIHHPVTTISLYSWCGNYDVRIITLHGKQYDLPCYRNMTITFTLVLIVQVIFSQS